MRTWLGVLFLGGCGGDYCGKLAEVSSECNGQEIAEADVDACREQLEPCDGNDQQLLEDSLDCSIDAGLFSCEADEPATGDPQTETVDVELMLSCYLPLAGVSPECAEVSVQ